jgi:hypothetical protein
MTREVFKVSAWGLFFFTLIQLHAHFGQWRPPAVTVLPDTVLDIPPPLIAMDAYAIDEIEPRYVPGTVTWDAPTSATRWAVGEPIQEVGE